MYWLMLVITFITIAIFPFTKWLYVNKFYNLSLYNKWIKFNSKFKFTRLMTIIISIIIIAIYIGIRWAPILHDTINGNWFSKQASEIRSSNISIILSLDICSFLAVSLPLLAIFNKWEIAKAISPIAILGAILTIFVSCYIIYNKSFDATLFFLNTDKLGLIQSQLGPLVFWMHLWILAYGVSAFTWHGRFTKKNWIILLSFIPIYLCYICTIAYTLDIKSHVTACVIGDYKYLDDSYYQGIPNDQWFVTYIAFNTIWPFKQWQWVAVFSWISFVFLISAVVIAINLIYMLFERNKMIMIDMLNQNN